MDKPVLFYSTNLQSEKVTFREALLKGIAPDKGLYMPETIPLLSKREIDSFVNKEYPEIAFEVIRKFTRGEIGDKQLGQLVAGAYNYEVPLEKVYDNKFVMRLDRGPTASFKDFAARMMARLISYYLSTNKQKLLILTATSGDTGSAIANAFYGLDNIKVVVLFPEKEVSLRQRKQMTTLGKNIHIVSVDGKFDDCQALVKQAFADTELNALNLSSANSINIGRLIPQSVYYFYAYSKLAKVAGSENVIFSIPSGNFGDMMGGLLALKMGLPIKKFIVATNANDVFPQLLETGEYNIISPSRNCISSAMNVGHPSNMARLIALYGGIMDEKGNISKMPDMQKMRSEIYSVSIDDNSTRQTIKETWEKHKVLLEPHGAVAWAGLQQYLFENPTNEPNLCVSLETAHPGKFPGEIAHILHFEPDLPPSLHGLEELPESYDHLHQDYSSFKSYLLDTF